MLRFCTLFEILFYNYLESFALLETLPFVPLQLNPYHGDNDNSINEPAYTLRNTQPVQLQSNFAQSPIQLSPYHAGYNQYTQPSNGNSYPRPDGSHLGYTQPQSTYPIVEEVTG